jgi:hypothetical protein
VEMYDVLVKFVFAVNEEVNATGSMFVAHEELNMVSNLAMLDGGFGDVIKTAREIRKNWGLITHPGRVVPPTWLVSTVKEHADKVLSNSSYASEIVTLKHDRIANITVPDCDLDGVLSGDPNSDVVDVVKGRKIVGRDTPKDALILCSQYSVCLHPKDSAIKRMMRATVPNDLKPIKGDNAESIQQRLAKNRWIDCLHQHTNDQITLTNGKPSNHTAMRRTMSVARDRPYKIMDADADDNSRSVMHMYSYICPEQPVPRWMCRPLRHRDFAFMNECWLDAWSYSTKVSRKKGPNWMQMMIYWEELGSEIRYHRDNSNKGSLTLMQQGKDPMGSRQTYAGVQHSQVPGSNVYIWTYAHGRRPMRIRFKVPNVHKGPSQDVKGYIDVPCFSFQCRDGYLCVLDPLDDILMVHGVSFDDLVLEAVVCSDECHNVDENDCTGAFRVAFVMRTLETMHEFYTDTSTIRLDREMKEAMRTSRANNVVVTESEGRNAFE